jgi:lysozyme
MRFRAALLFAVPSIVACGAQNDPLGEAQDAITVCPGASTLKGIDVSHYDGTIDWPTVKSGGIAFSFAKATEGTTYVDPTFATNWNGMKSAGITRGAYHFFHSNMDVTTQVDFYLSTVGTFSPGDLPPTLDLEVTDGSSPATVSSTAIAWLDAVAAKTGTKPILYASPSFVTSDMGSPAGLENHAILWLANYGVTCPDVPAPYTSWTIWQSSSTATVTGVPGSSGACDIDTFDGNAAALAAITVGGSGSSGSGSSGSSTSSSSSGSTAPACQVNGVDGTCIDTSVCATMSGYIATPGFCPGPVNEQCCTPTSTASSSTSSGSASGSSSASSASSTTSAGGTGGASGTGGSAGTSSGAGGASTGSSSSTAGGTGAAGSSGGTSSGGTGASSSGTGAHSTGGLLGSPGASSGCATAPERRGDGAPTRGLALALAGLTLAVARRRRANG